MKVQSSDSSATYGTNSDYTLRWSGDAANPNSSVAITEVNSDGKFTVTFGASSGLGILWIDAINDSLTEGPEFAFFEIVGDDSYEIMAVSQNDYLSVGEYSYTRTCEYVGDTTLVVPNDSGGIEWRNVDFFLHYLDGPSTPINFADKSLQDNHRQANSVASHCNTHRTSAKNQVLQDFINEKPLGSFSSESYCNVTNKPGLLVLGNGLNVGETTSTIVTCSNPPQNIIPSGYSNESGIFVERDKNNGILSTIQFYTVTSTHTFTRNDLFTDPASFAPNGNSDDNFRMMLNFMNMEDTSWANGVAVVAVTDLSVLFAQFGDTVIACGLTGYDCAQICNTMLQKAQSGAIDVYPYSLNVEWTETQTSIIMETITYPEF